ncbi:hypothetical protein [Lysinibacillus sp. BW-2-10]|uniref:hypothetical protein n=1 Tax=Lysinibacillus sp. BW-2-10 TaxID=2590030 RepID=UPI00117DFB4C|nr:hypothetical protein [Lysinibacillus sp. BW-2-10]TSI02265.1 hypothetical protein FJQ64_19015 [Lysinibacillus sp. BW-2-10]
MLQFVIPKEKYSLCLVNPGKKDVQEVYLKYGGHAVDGTIFYDFEPIQMQLELLYGESYAILEDYHAWDLDTTFFYEVLYVSEDGIILKKFFRKNLDNVSIAESHPLFTTSIWEVEETASEYINAEDIVQIVTNDIYASKVPTKNSTYRYLLNRSDLFKQFFTDLYEEIDSFYHGDHRYSKLKLDFRSFLYTQYGLQLESSEESEIILSNCVAIMRKLHLSQTQMAEYFMEYIL